MPAQHDRGFGNVPEYGTHVNGTFSESPVGGANSKGPIAICGMALRLPGGLGSPKELWDFLLTKGDARRRVPESRFNIAAYYSASGRPGTVISEFGYFLDDNIKLGSLDGSRFSLSRAELDSTDPQHRQMLEVVRECFDDAGEVNFKGRQIGCYMGSWGEDWLEMQNRDPLQNGPYRVDGYGDYMLSNRISYEMDLRGPSVTVRTACSSALIGFHESCMAIQRGDCEAAIVGGANLILTPGRTAFLSEAGVLSPDGSSKAFSADADGFARGEAITALYLKPLDTAIRDGNPIRAIVRSTLSNSDGKTHGIKQPSTEQHEVLIRKTYQAAGITDFSKTAFVECHGTGTAVGDPLEVNAVARVFGDSGTFITSVKPNLGHSEGASGLTSVIKAVLALEHRIIPPNIKFTSPNPRIPFVKAKLTVPVEATPWPESRSERVSVNCFGIGGSNAHVVLDSARSVNIPTPRSQLGANPELLIFSAASAASLQRMIQSFQDWVSNESGNLEHLAYTLAIHREHLPHRAFMVAHRDKPGIPSHGRKAPHQAPNLVMVFTGQGAQWPRMGRQLLLRANWVFQNSIRTLDAYLREVEEPPEWTLEEELLKPAKTSRVQTSELSQPLCTAVQVGLVDLFASVGVEPTAVVGHSSGEIAAAYAAGALTGREAIIAAWQRGLCTQMQTKPGAMAAVGLGWKEVTEFLGPNVVVACENSSQSVTISGDANGVQETISRIKQAHPDVLARLIKVDKAYHSYHMREVGQEYYSATRQHVVGISPRKPFFSSVTGTGKPEDEILGAAYWQRNLESPVLFRLAISGVLKHVENVAFLEIGPHGALAGPVRQILGEASSEASRSVPYITAMMRGEDCVESFLTAIGKLYELRVGIDFKALLPNGVCLPDLPPYPWDHEASYNVLRESRISREWRSREHPSHPLLGVRQLEDTSLEPSWRCVLSADSVSWLRDHKVEDNVVVPCAAYIALVGEAIRQVSGSQDSFTLRDLVIKSALVIAEGSQYELVTTFRPHRLTDTLDSQFWDFTISSHNGHTWMKHCTGQVSSQTAQLAQSQDAAPLPRKLESRKYYDVFRLAGLGFGPHFQRLEDIRSGTLENLATAKISDDRSGDEKDYFLHPTAIDAAIQSVIFAATKGHMEESIYRVVPTKIDMLTIHRCAADAEMRLSASATVAKGSSKVIGQVQCVADSNVVLQMQGLKVSPLEEAQAPEADDIFPTARLTWGPHIDFLDAAKLIKPTLPLHLYTPLLDELGRLCMVYSDRRIKETQTALPHMLKYRAWLAGQVQSLGEHSSISALDDAAILERVAGLVDSMSDTPLASCAVALQRVANNISSLFTGETEPMEVLLADDVLTNLYTSTDSCDRTPFIRQLAHSKPNLRILEIGAGTGSFTGSILKDLVLPIGQPLYSKYAFTDISSAFFVSAKEHFKSYRNIEYRVLDISKDPSEQGFGSEKYDLIIANNVIHATRSLGESLKNVRKLLDPNGRFLLYEFYLVSKWPNFIFGTLPGWWYGESDGRSDEPCVTPERWEVELKAAGFEGLDAVVLDAEAPHHLNATMVAKPQVDSSRIKKSVTLLCDESNNNESHVDSLSLKLQSRGYSVQLCRLGEELPVSQDVISLLDCSRPFFEDIDEARYSAFKQLLDSLEGLGLLWVTESCQIKCQNPRYAQVIGAARTIRTEMLLDIATCEVDDIGSSLDSIVDVFAKFQAREEDEKLKPDYEYAIIDGVVNVSRICPFSMEEDILTKRDPEDPIGLEVAKLGRLSSLRWGSRELRLLRGDEVDIRIHAAGLNFRDVLGALAVVPLPGDGLGLEASGEVLRVGQDVKDLRQGDRVMLLGFGALSTRMVVTEKLCEKIPDSLTFDKAASIPTVFVTAACSLFDIGGLQKGQSVLIHSACGGVGLAAIQLARMVGAEIYTTVGSDDKVAYLTNTFRLPRNRIFYSRDASFEDALMRETDGKGVDLVLNSLSGELLHATWRCVGEFGKMVDIGKRDFLGAATLDMSSFLTSRSYCSIHIDQLMVKRPSACKELLRSVIGYLEAGHITPIRLSKVFEPQTIEDAFRYMQQGQHIGKIIVSLRDNTDGIKIDTLPLKKTVKLHLDGSASYLLVGGLGGLGRSVARHLVEHNARRLVFLSRSAGTDPEDRDFIQELESMGCEVRLVKGSVANKDDVSRAIQQSPNLKGIMQISMVLRDEAFPRMTLSDWNTTTSAKVQGTWNLHDATVAADIPLDFFVLFSSLSGVTGQAGQANYAAANTFLDSFVQYRANMGLAATSIDLGAVQEVGYVSKDEALLKKIAVVSAHKVTEFELLEAITAALTSFSAPPKAKPDTLETTFVDRNTFMLGLGTAMSISNPKSVAFWRKDRRIAVYQNSSRTAVNEISSNSKNDYLKTFLAKARDDSTTLMKAETVALFVTEIRRRLSSFLLKLEEELNTTVPLSQLGMDSLIGVEMRVWWRQVFGFDITLLELLGMGNLEALGKYAADRLLKALGEDPS